jgi:hypothetical protein
MNIKKSVLLRMLDTIADLVYMIKEYDIEFLEYKQKSPCYL